MTKLSVLLIVKNEERQIANCLKTVAFADEIIVILDKCTSIYNQYSLTTSNRDKLKDYLTQHTIGNNIYYPIPFHLQECFECPIDSRYISNTQVVADLLWA